MRDQIRREEQKMRLPLWSRIRAMVLKFKKPERNPRDADDDIIVLSHIISQLRPGADLSRVTLPTFILEPRSMLERITKCVWLTDPTNHGLTFKPQFYGASRNPSAHAQSRRPCGALCFRGQILSQRVAY